MKKLVVVEPTTRLVLEKHVYLIEVEDECTIEEVQEYIDREGVGVDWKCTTIEIESEYTGDADDPCVVELDDIEDALHLNKFLEV